MMNRDANDYFLNTPFGATRARPALHFIAIELRRGGGEKNAFWRLVDESLIAPGRQRHSVASPIHITGSPASLNSTREIQSGQNVDHKSDVKGIMKITLPSHQMYFSPGLCTFPYVAARLEDASSEGDGTVPSGLGQALLGVLYAKAVPNIEHQPALKDSTVQGFVAAAMQRIVKAWFDEQIGN